MAAYEGQIEDSCGLEEPQPTPRSAAPLKIRCSKRTTWREKDIAIDVSQRCLDDGAAIVFNVVGREIRGTQRLAETSVAASHFVQCDRAQHGVAPRARSIATPQLIFVDDLEAVACVDLVGRKDAIFTVDFEDGDRGHEVAGSWKAWFCTSERSVFI